jgi:hypothetical protein
MQTAGAWFDAHIACFKDAMKNYIKRHSHEWTSTRLRVIGYRNAADLYEKDASTRYREFTIRFEVLGLRDDRVVVKVKLMKDLIDCEYRKTVRSEILNFGEQKEYVPDWKKEGF